MKPRFALASIACPLAFITLTSSAFAADASFSAIQYTNLGWDNNSIWTPAAFPGAQGATGNVDTATFANEGSHLITMPSTGGLVNIGNVVFSTSGATPNTYIFNANSLLLSSGGAITANGSFTGRAAFNSTTTLQGNGSFTGNGTTGSSMVFNAVNTVASLGNATLTLGGSNTGTSNIAGNMINGIVSEGSGTVLKLSKAGSGTWTLANANTYTGGSDLGGGTVILGNANGLGSSGSISVNANSTIRSLVAPAVTFAGRLVLGDGATLTYDTYNAAVQTWSGILGTGALASGGFTKTGLGQLTLAPADGEVQTWKGDTTVDMGTLFLDGNSQTFDFSNLIDPASDLVLSGGTLYYRGKATFTSSQTFASTKLNAGSSQLRPASGTGTNVLNLGDISRSAGGVLNIVNASGYSYTTSNADGFLKGVIWNSNDLAAASTGAIGAATYTTENDASLWTVGTTNYDTAGAVSGTVGTGGTVSINGLKLNNASSQSFAINGTLDIAGGLVFGSAIGANASEISGGNLTSSSDELVIVNNNAQNTLGTNTISSVISGATDLTILNAANNSTLFLTGANTYTGNTYIGGNFNGNTGNSITLVGGAAGASIGSAGKTVLVAGGSGGLSNVLQVGNNDATGDVKGTIQLEDGRLSLKRNDTFTLSAKVAGTKGGGYISQDNPTGNATIEFAPGNNFFAGIRGATGASAGGTINLTGPGSFNTFGLQPLDSGNAGNDGSLNGMKINFKSGTHVLSGSFNNGRLGNVTFGIDGGDVIWGGARWWARWGYTINVSAGSLTVGSGTFSGGDYANSNPSVINISGGIFQMGAGTMAVTGKADSTAPTTVNQTGGQANIGLVAAPNATVGSTANLTIGIASATQASTYALSAGVLRVAGTIAAGGAPAAGSNNFNWTGGRLNARTVTTANLTGNSVASTLVQNGATTILSPGDTYNSQVFSGKTDVTGSYTLTAGKFAIGIGGTVQANSYHDSPSEYDTVAVSGTATLGAGAALEVTLNNGFVPGNANTFTILTGGTVSGNFSNLTSGRIILSGGDSFAVTVIDDVTDSVVLSDYQPVGGGGDDYSTWATDNGIPGQPFDGDFDKDGISNGAEYALGKNPTVSSQPAGALTGNTITFTKGADAIANSDVSWIIETSTTLDAGSWTAEVTQAAGDPALSIGYTFTPGTPAKKFARLKVVQVP
jgi:autotransporter-associated beta strand protein